MARNIAGYISNISKSVGYSALDKIKTISPVTGEFTETNSELFKSMYSNIRDFKGSYVRGMDIVKKSKIYEAADVGVNAIFEDIKSGNLYNKQREDTLASKILGMDSDSMDSFDMGDSNDDFDMSFDDDFGDFNDVTTGDKVVTASIHESSRNNAEMVSMTVARTGQQIINSQKASTHILYTQNLQAYNLFNNNLNNINQNISNIVKFSTDVMQIFAQNSNKYYEESTKLLQDQTALLRQIAESLAPPKAKEEKHQKKRITYNDLVGAEGAPDLKEYFKNVKKNAIDQLGMFGSMGSMMGEDSNSLLAFVSSPLKFIPDMIVNKLVPKAVEKSMGELDKSLSGFFGSLMTKFNTMANDEDNIISSTLGKIFGIKNSIKSTLDTSKYEKGKVDWDGKSRKALIEVIPTQLAKIVSLLSGKPEKMYDYDKGKFIDSSTIKKDFDKSKEQYSKRATSDLRSRFDEYSKLLSFNSLDDKEKFNKDIDTFFDHLYTTGNLFDYNKNPKDDYAKYGIDSKSYAAIRAMFRKSERHLKHTLNRDIMENRDRQNSDMINAETIGDSIKTYLFNNSDMEEFVIDPKKKSKNKSSIGGMKSLVDTIDNRGKNVFFYLQNIYKELYNIRLGSVGGSRSQNGILYTSNDDFIDTSTSIYKLVADTTPKSQVTLDRENKERARERFLREENKRRQKNKTLINFSDINDEDLEKNITAKIDIENIEKFLGEQQEKPKTMIEKLLEAESLTGKMKTITEKLNDLSKKPVSFITKTISKVDERLYEVIYGVDGDNAKKGPKGFIDALILNLKTTFSKFNTWLDEKILEPLKEKMNVQSFKDVGAKVFGMFGIDPKEIGDNIKKYLLGEKDGDGKRTGGLFSNIVESTKDVFKSALSTVKESLKNAYSPLLSKIKSAMPTKQPKEFSLDDLEENDELIEDENGKLIVKKKSIADIIDNMYQKPANSKTQSYYDNFDFDGAIDNLSVSDKRKYLQLNSMIPLDIAEKEERARKLYNSLMEKATKPSRSLIRQIKKVEKELAHYEGLRNSKKDYTSKFTSMINEKVDIFKPLNVPFYEHKEKTASELLDLYPGLATSPLIQSEQDGTNNSLFSKLSDNVEKIKDALLRISPERKKSVKKIITNSLDAELLNTEEGQATNEFAKELSGIMSNTIANWMHGKIPHFDKGSKGKIQKATVATVGEGEIVVNKNTVTQLEEILNKLLTGTNEGKSGDLLAQIAKKDLNGRTMSDSDIESILDTNPKLAELFYGQDPETARKLKNILKVANSQSGKISQTTVQSPTMMDELLADIKRGSVEARNALFGEPKKDSKKMREIVSDVTSNISEYAPEAIGSALLGGGISLFTGLIGGPLLGAAVGAGISITKNSKTVQTALFGEEINGELKEGLLPKEFVTGVKKYLPDLKTFGIAGAATGLVPFLPFGPVGGLLLGSSLAFAKNNETVNKTLFGEEGLFDPASRDKMKKILPRVGLGAAAGLFMGPFGILGNALLGSGLGMLSTTEKFEEIMLGVKNEATGERYGGLLPMLKTTVVDPMKNYMTGLGERVTKFLKEDVIKPIASAFKPIRKDVQLLLGGMFKSVGKTLDKMFEKSFGVPFIKAIQEALVEPIAKKLGKAFTTAKNFGKGMLSVPAGMIGKYGDSRRRKHIASGNADYMTAEERINFRKDKGISKRKDSYLQTDEILANLGYEDLATIQDGLFNIKNSKDVMAKNRKNMIYDMSKEVYPYLDYATSKKVMSNITKGKHDKAYKIINDSNLDPRVKKSILEKLSSKTGDFDKLRADKDSELLFRNEIYEKLSKYGLNVNSDNLDSVYKMINTEAGSKKKLERAVDGKDPVNIDIAVKNHNEIVELFNKVINALEYNNTDIAEKNQLEVLKEKQRKEKEKRLNELNKERAKIGLPPEEFREGKSIKSISQDKLNVKRLVKPKEKVKEEFFDDGSVIKFKQDSRGNWIPDMTDTVSKKKVKEEAKEEELQNTLFDKIKNSVKSITEPEEKKESFLSKLMSGIGGLGGIIKTILPVGLMALFMSGNGGSILEGIKGLLKGAGNSISKLFGYEDKDGDGNTVDEAGNKAASLFGRQVLTNSSTGKLAGRIFTSPLKLIPGVNVLRKGVVKSADKLGNATEWATKHTVDKIGGNYSLNSLKEKLGAKIKSGAGVVEEGSEAVLKNDSLIKSLITKMEKFFIKILDNGMVRALIKPKNADRLIKEAVPKIIKEISERAAKASSKAIAKAVGGISTGGILNGIWAVADFISGFNDADNTLGITEEYVTFGSKIVSGLISAISGLLIVTDFVPEATWVDLFCSTVLPIVDKDSDLIKDREMSEAKMEAYNKEHGTNYKSVQEFNDATRTPSFWEKATNKVKEVGKKVAGWFTPKNKENVQTTNNQNGMVPSGVGGDNLPTNYRSRLGVGGGADVKETPNPKKKKSLSQMVKDNTVKGIKPEFRYVDGKYIPYNVGVNPKLGTEYFKNEKEYRKSGPVLGSVLKKEQQEKEFDRKYGRGGEAAQLTESNIRYHDLRKSAGANVTGSDLNSWIDRKNNKGMMKNSGNSFIAAANKTQLDPRYIAAHAAWESGWGTSKISKDKYNMFGIGAYNSSPYQSAYTFKNLEDGIVAGAEWIRKNYTDKQQYTLDSMVYGPKKYCVTDDGKPSESWVKGISNIMYNSPKIGLGYLDKSPSINSPGGDTTTWGDGSTGTAGTNNGIDSGKPSIQNLFSDISGMYTNSLSSLFGVDLSGGQNSEMIDPEASGIDNSGEKFDDSSSMPADDWFKRTLNNAIVTSPYGMRTIFGGNSMHHGIDYSGGGGSIKGTPIQTPVNGTIEYTKPEKTSGGFGNMITMKDDNNHYHFFSHLNELPSLKAGQKVKVGDTIGKVGNTGKSTGTHLHYEVRSDLNNRQTAIEPNKYFRSLASSTNSKTRSVAPPEVPQQPQVELPELPKRGVGGEDPKLFKNNNSKDYTKLLITMIEALMKITTNTECLSKITKLLTEKLGVEVPKDVKSSLNKQSTSKQMVSIIKQVAGEERNPDNEYLLSVLDQLAMQ